MKMIFILVSVLSAYASDKNKVELKIDPNANHADDSAFDIKAPAAPTKTPLTLYQNPATGQFLELKTVDPIEALLKTQGELSPSAGSTVAAGFRFGFEVN